MKTGHCIICHKDNVEMTDEHVIPDALGGYYHIYCVCKACNSKLGDNVDVKLINHWIMKGERLVNQLKGKKNNIPNPLIGDATLEDGTKVRLEENKSGQLAAHILPTSPKINPDGKSFTITVDAGDEKLVDKMVRKVTRKMGLKEGEYKLSSTKNVQKIDRPWVKQYAVIDLNDYKIGLLKIAYEFAVDKIPAYYDDPKARLYSKILEDGAIDRLGEVDFVGDAFLNASLLPMNDFIDYTKPKRHYLLLINSNGKLYCLIKLFDSICQLIVMSDNEYPEIGPLYVAINDFGSSECKFYSVEELVNATCTLKNRGARFSDEDNKLIDHEAATTDDKTQFGFACDAYSDNILYVEDGRAVITQADLINRLEKSDCVTTENSAGIMKDVYTVPDGLYIKLMPCGKLFHPVEFIYETRINKL